MTQVFSPFVPGLAQDGHHGYNLLYDNHPVDNYLDDSSDSNQKSLDKHDGKQQATFLTKLYALLERPEYHHMIRWDPKGEQIIVERPEQLALHVLPSIYRQSRFASFSRQLNIYGFMRKVNLRNVDPAIDDPDASTWSHPTLSRHSPPEVIANFKRRVPPRTPKARKRPDEGIAISNKPTLNKTPSSQPQRPIVSRPRGLSASSIPSDPQRPTVQYSQPQHHQQQQSQPLQQPEHPPVAASPYALQPVTTPSLPYPQPQNSKWNHSYGRNALPPLTIPTSFLPHASYSAFPALGYSHNSSKPPLTPTDDSQYTPSVYQPSQPSVRGDSTSIFSGFSFSSSDPPSAATSPIGLTGGFGSSGFSTPAWSSYESHTQPPPLNPSPSNGTSSLSALLNPSNISSFNRPPLANTSHKVHIPHPSTVFLLTVDCRG
ncbi:hypothetical protein BS47DRAFT_696059 [Hydnum rufescens UP504]|uniref:HSF-type DNA-binding domain-containing protein n=1 Tax=Hydnum rufescens UP504 TaxID=1448309 RepID=A0A9P6B3B1_9AGAM|nr:hypothetical protein BS47DRAFT_696059 [Hydnum rufescens UP504]